MKFIPILFSTPMVQAIQEGRKTQTRRTKGVSEISNHKSITAEMSYGGAMVEFIHEGDGGVSFAGRVSPYGQPGDVLWVRENHFAWGKWTQEWIEKNKRVGRVFQHIKTDETDFCFDETLTVKGETFVLPVEKPFSHSIGWHKRSSLFMPKQACRFFLEVVSIRVERLHDISEVDAKSEGISIVDEDPVIYNNYLHNKKNAMWPGYGSISQTYGFTNPKDSFHSLWESINGIESWAINPWVWVVEFKKIEKPENFL
jgi:hypothetical protein